MFGALWSSIFGRPPLKTGVGVVDCDPPPAAEKPVTVDAALQLSAFWACVRITASTLGSVPVKVYRKGRDGSRDVADAHPLHEILAHSPNAHHTPLEFIEGMIASCLIQGNGYAERSVNGSGRLVALEQFTDPVRPVRGSGGLIYELNDRGRIERLPPEKVFHLRAFGVGGIEGLSAIRHGVQTFSSAMATDETAAKVFANGLHASGVFTAPAETMLTDEQRALAETMIKSFSGSRRAGKALLLEGGFTYSPISMNPEDAQMLETRRFNIEEICRWTGTPPIIIGHAAEGQTMFGSGVEQIMLAWLMLGLNPLMRRFEARVLKDLIAPAERSTHYAEFNRDALMQADSAARAEFLSKMVQNGVMTRNEARALINRPASAEANADSLTAQVNLAPLARLGETRAFLPETAP